MALPEAGSVGGPAESVRERSATAPGLLGSRQDARVPAAAASVAEAAVRFRLDLGYAGGGFHGWATQPGLRTVQGTLEAALAKICGVPVRTVVAGRTDAGVHARRQVVHLDLPETTAARLGGTQGKRRRTPAEGLTSRLRGVLAHLEAPDVVVHAAQEVPAEFDARFSAVWRRYSYRIADAAAFLDPLAVGHTVQLRGELDVERMAAAAAELLGLHDFLPFCKPRPESTTIRTLQALTVTRGAGDGAITLGLQADAFCHHMVRALVGALVKVGHGSWDVTAPAEQLARAEAGAAKTALAPMHLMPAHGLVLEEVGYPEGPAGWAEQAETARNRRSAEELQG
ncbi:tRNA pseudouridine(38-40) synthase TruA [Brevibacterium sp.]|uniref:tRNA pseudouridine(38-40) synthase TruA n=1 Tax=Brevibacterium sp. TaxID=1701 RepID=UPI003434F65D